MEITGVETLEQRLRGYPMKVRKAMIRKGLRKAAKIIQRDAKANAPDVSGTLDQAIKIRSGRRKTGFVSIKIGTGHGDDPLVFYSSFVQLGFKHGKTQVPPHRFLKNAADENHVNVADAITGSLEIAMRDADV